ncbi:MAG TPA: tetratricopeptide repeat protein [Gemmatimonadales bacterium]|nr:tetratricopeptide repeat protein [Gemmatimonadales bacterium]
MAYTSEIEKLEKRWAENPKGRNFAPLADAYRKAGELDRALELCTAGLQLHPDYVSAHIVHARCLIDQKNDAGASEVFQRVLALDPENVLALKMLAEIAERGGRFDQAVEWLGRLLAADPMNGEAAEHLARAKAKAAQPPAPKSPEPVARIVPETLQTAARPAPRPAATRPPSGSQRAISPPVPPAPPAPPPAAQPDFVVEHASDGPTSPTLDVKGTPADIETFDGTIDFNAAARDAAKADGIEVQEEVQLTPQDLVVEGLAHTQYESGIFAKPPEAEVDDGSGFPKIDLPLIMPDDVPEAVPATPARVADAAPTPPPVPPRPSPPAPPSPPTPRPPAPQPPAAVALSDDDGAADAAALSRAEPVLTETMAELYLRQGHQEDALRVYQALLAQRPGDARLRSRIESLSPGGRKQARADAGRGGGENVQAFLKRILAARPGEGAAASTDARPSGGRSPLERAFAVVPPEVETDPGATAPGEATRPASEGISLDAVFGDEGPRSSIPAAPPTPPLAAEPTPPPTAPSVGFSFDQFFSPAPAPAPAPVAGASPAASGSPDAPPARPSGGRATPPVEDESDLDQFQAWLRGLKS